MNYYNDNDPFAVKWLRELIKNGLIPNGEVDERSIAGVTASDLKGFVGVHFFAGIGGWAYALRLAAWQDNRPVWTGSCPCQPFSVAGQRGGTADKRHLWPEFKRLIGACNPPVVFGEQVASKDGRLWLAGVFSDLEGMAYRRAAADLCAAGVGAPHIRQRLYWVADTMWAGRPEGRAVSGSGSPSRSRNNGGLEHADVSGEHRRASGRRQPLRDVGNGEGEGLGNAHHQRPQGWSLNGIGRFDQQPPWSSSVVIRCSDDKLRRIPANAENEPEPTLFPMAHGIPNRMGTLRGSGNAINPWLAAEFIAAYLDTTDS